MTEAPPPLTPEGCDLRGLEWMPLYGDRLFASETWLMASPEGKIAALALWWAAWKQKPAASLADDDRIFAQLAGYGMQIAAWRKVKTEALRGWVKCSDGRLYHPVVAEFALDAYARRRREREKKQRQRDRGGQGDGPFMSPDRSPDRPPPKRGDNPGAVPGDKHGDVPPDRTGQDRTGEERDGNPPSPPTEARPPRATRLPADWMPDEGLRAYARDKGLDPDAVAEKFRNYWHAKAGKDGAKLDWPATFRNWCITEAERRPGTRPGRGRDHSWIAEASREFAFGGGFHGESGGARVIEPDGEPVA